MSDPYRTPGLAGSYPTTPTPMNGSMMTRWTSHCGEVKLQWLSGEDDSGELHVGSTYACLDVEDLRELRYILDRAIAEMSSP